MWRDMGSVVLTIGIALVVVGVLVLGTAAGSDQSACQAQTRLEFALVELTGLDLDRTSDAALGGAVSAVGSATKHLAEATETAGSPEYRALAAAIEGIAQVFAPAGDDRSVTEHRALVQQALLVLVDQAEAYARSLALSC